MGFSKLFSRFKNKKEEPKIKSSKFHYDTSNVQYMLDSINASSANIDQFKKNAIDESSSTDMIYKAVDKLLWSPDFLALFLTSFPIATYDIFAEFICDNITTENNSKKSEVKDTIYQYKNCAEAFDSLMDTAQKDEERYYEKTIEEFKVLETTEEDFDPPVDNSDPKETYFDKDVIDVPGEELAIEIVEE